MIWELAEPETVEGPFFAELQPLGGIAWTRRRFQGVPIDLGNLQLAPVNVDNGIVPRFNDPFSTYRIALPDGSEVRVSVYESNYDGALMRGGTCTPELRDWIASRYGIHRWSDSQWHDATLGARSRGPVTGTANGQVAVPDVASKGIEA